METKRVRLMRSVLRFHMEHLKTKQVYDKDFKPIATVVNSLNRRIKKALRRKVEVTQLSIVEEFECSFVGPRGKKTRKEVIEAVSTRNARKILRDIYGKNVKIKSVKKKRI